MARIQIHRMTAEEKAKELERLRSRARHDEAQALAHERRKAEHRSSIKIAKAMKAKGMTTNDIADLTGLTVDDVLRL